MTLIKLVWMLAVFGVLSSFPAISEELAVLDASSEYRLKVGDKLLISVYGNDQTKQEVTVDPRGTISYLFVDGLPVLGKTIAELRSDLSERLKGYFRYFKLAITPIQFNAEYYSVIGNVKTPGKQPLIGKPTALSALCKANGFTVVDYRDQLYDLSDLDRTFLARKGQFVPIDFTKLVKYGDLTQNVPLQAGDFIFVTPRAFHQVFVLGEVLNPKSIEYLSDISLIEAIAEAGDVTERASSRVAVIRGSLTHPVKYLVDYSRMVKGCCRNFPLQEGDIVYVPPRKLYLWREIFRSALAAFVGTVAAEAGIQLYIHMNPDAESVIGNNGFISDGGVIIVP